MIKQALDLRTEYRHARMPGVTKATVTNARRLFEKIEKAYNVPAFQDGEPRLGLVTLGNWLMAALGRDGQASPQQVSSHVMMFEVSVY